MKFFKRFILVLLFASLLSCVISSIRVLGTKIESDKGQVGVLSDTMRSSSASGQGTHTNFKDPQVSGLKPEHTVVNFLHKTNRWVTINYYYYAHGFNASFAEEDNINAGIIAMSGISYSQASWDGQKSGYVYDTVTARSSILFEFMFLTVGEKRAKTIPVSIGVNMKMEVMTDSDDDYARAYADVKLYQDSKELRHYWVKSTSEKGEEPVTKPILIDELPISSGPCSILGDDEQIYFSFNQLELEPYKKYRLHLTGSASVHGTFMPEDTTGGAKASIVVDPSIHISPDFPDADDYYVLISPGLIDENHTEESTITLSLLQGGEEVTQVDVDGGPVSMVAPTVLDRNFTTSYMWSSMDPNFIDIDGEPFDSNFTFDPSEIQPGLYTVHLLTYPPLDPGRGSINFNIVSGSQPEPEPEPEPETEPDQQPKPGSIPGFNMESVIFGILAGAFVLYIIQRGVRARFSISRAIDLPVS